MQVFTTPSEAYLYTLNDVITHPDYLTKPRGQECFEKVDYAFRVSDPSSSPLITKDADRNSVLAEYLAKEFNLYASKTNKAEDFAQASKFWAHIANPDGTINSAYGHLIWEQRSLGNPKFEVVDNAGTGQMRTPWEWCAASLAKDKDTRQAVLRFSLPSHQWFGNKDQVCTMHGNFLIRDDKLHLTIVMRSCDLVKGLAYDMPWFCFLIEKMVSNLRMFTYSSLQIGTYTHIAHSLHVYVKDLDKVKKMIGAT